MSFLSLTVGLYWFALNEDSLDLNVSQGNCTAQRSKACIMCLCTYTYGTVIYCHLNLMVMLFYAVLIILPHLQKKVIAEREFVKICIDGCCTGFYLGF